MNQNKKDPARKARIARAGTALLIALLVTACGALADRPGPLDPMPASANTRMGAVATNRPDQCLAEGQDCSAKNAVCCTGYTCAGIHKSICVLAY